MHVSKTIKWDLMEIDGKNICPICDKVMFIYPISTLPSFAFCPHCEKYFYNMSEKKYEPYEYRK